jgi:hypothetical protein
MEINYLTKDEFYAKAKELEGGHWLPQTLDTRWDYHKRVVELLRSFNIKDAQRVLEMGTMGMTCIKGSHTIDYAERWNFPGKTPNYIHDARVFPWPMPDKKYDVFIALRVFQHLAPVQRECVLEAMRVAKKVIIVVPAEYTSSVHPESKGISYKDFCYFLGGIHPNLYFNTTYGDFYFWDTENPSALDIEEVMKKTEVIKVRQTITELKPGKLRRLVNKLKRLVS